MPGHQKIGTTRLLSLLTMLALLLSLFPALPVQAAPAFQWNGPRTVQLGMQGAIMAPALMVRTGATGAEGIYSDLVVSQAPAFADNQPAEQFFTSDSGQLLDLGEVDFDQVPPLSGKYGAQVKAIPNHVYLLLTSNTIAKIKVLRIVPNEKPYGLPSVYFKYSWGAVGLEDVLPDASTWKPGATTPSPGTGATTPTQGSTYAWVGPRTVQLGMQGLIMAPALMVRTGATGTEGLDSDLVVSQAPAFADNQPAEQFFTSDSGRLLDLGEVDFDQVPPLSGQYGAQVKAIPNHVYLLLTNNTIAKIKVLRIIPNERPYGLPSVYFKYSWGPVGLEDTLPDASTWKPAAPAPVTPDPVITPDPVVTPDPVPPVDDTPATIDLKATVSGGKVILTWTAPSPAPAGGYNVFRGATQDVTSLQNRTDFPVTETTFTDDAVTKGQTYYFMVAAVGGGQSQVVKVTVVDTPAVVRHTVIFHLGNQLATVDDVQKELDVPAQLISGRSMVPLRFLGDALGADLKWDQSERKVTYTLGDRTLILWVDKTVAYLNGKQLELDVPPMLVGGRTLLPLRFVSEQLGAGVKFDDTTKSVTVVYPKADSTGNDPQPQNPTAATTPAFAYAVYDNNRLVKVDLTSAQPQTKFDTVFAPAGGIVQFRLSPSGKLIAYGDKAGRLVVRDLAAGTEKVLFTPGGKATGMEMVGSWHYRKNAATPYAWAPGSDNTVFFLYLPDGQADPTLMMANLTTNQVYKVKTPAYDVAITSQGKLLLSEGNQFAYYSTQTLDLDTKLTYDGTHTDRTSGEWYHRSMEASTSADGRYVAYLGFGSSRVYVYDTTTNTGGQFFYEATAKFEHPRLSADGQQVLVGGYGDLWLLSPGNKYRQVTDNGHLTNPDWAAAPVQGGGTAEAKPSTVNGIRFGIYELRTALIGYTVQNWSAADIEKSGALVNSLLQLNQDGTYVWASKWDGRVIQGTWRKFDGSSILLSSGESGRDWLITAKQGAYSAAGSDDIDLYNESTQYLGRFAGDN